MIPLEDNDPSQNVPVAAPDIRPPPGYPSQNGPSAAPEIRPPPSAIEGEEVVTFTISKPAEQEMEVNAGFVKGPTHNVRDEIQINTMSKPPVEE